MPVMDGFTFCKKTISFYENKIQLFDEHQNEKENEERPFMIACSANITEEIE